MPEEIFYRIGGQEFTERETGLVENCITYASSYTAGLPGHNLIILVAKLARVANLKNREDFYIADDLE